MADARTQILPLVGGGEHDWTTISLPAGALFDYDTVIAGLVSAAGAGQECSAVRCSHINSYNNLNTQHITPQTLHRRRFDSQRSDKTIGDRYELDQ